MASVDSLELKIKGNAKSAQKSIDTLIGTLDKLKKATAGACGLGAVSDKMGDVSNKLNQVKNVNLGLSAANTKTAKSFKLLAGAFSFHRITSAVSSWISKSNNYVEDLNLFTASMGEYASAAKEYAETISEVMGIDPSTWLRNQGVFMTLATGFGVAGDRASTMSQQLTQLGYDLSSFFNISVEDAMQKLQSGIAGELEPLRRLGYDLSKAKLEAIALSLGIDKTFDAMTQAEKAQLRYYAIMTQVTTAQGDMSRTLKAPANQLRIFKAQLEQAARSLGNIFIPMLNAVLPYAIAFVKVIRDIATELASLAGFELPEVDYSGVSTVVGDVSSDLDEATESAKKLKKTLLGIDELNVLADTDTGSTDSDSVTDGFDFELPTYDFMGAITDNVDEVYKKLKKVFTPLKKIVKKLFEYKEIILMGAGLVALTKVWNKLTTFWVWFKGLKLVDVFLDGFYLIKTTGGNVFQSLRGGIDNVRMNLTGIQKAAIVAVAGFAEFTVVKKNISELAQGCENAGAKIAEIGVVAAAAAAAMYVAMGPVGIAVAAVVGLIGVMVGLGEAIEAVRQQAVDEAFFNGVGTSLDTFKTKLELVTEQFSTQYDLIGGWKSQIDDKDNIIGQTTLKIETLGTTLGSTGVVTEEEIGKIKEQFRILYEAVSEKMTLSEEIILTALAGALKRATPEISAEIDKLIGEYQRYVRETQGRAAELQMLIDNGYDQLIGKSKDDPAYQEIMANISAWYEELGYLSGGMSDASWQWQQTVNDFNSGEIDFGEDIGTAKEKIAEIASVGQTALTDLATARDATLKALDESIAYAAKYKTEDLPMLFDIREKLEADYAAQEEQIKNELNSIFNAIQEGMVGKIADTKAALEQAWVDNGSKGDMEKYVREGLKQEQDYFDQLSAAIQGHMDTLKTDGSAWAGDAMEGIIDALFDTTTRVSGRGRGHKHTYYSYKQSLEEAIEQVYSELEESGKKVSYDAGEEIANGLGTGIADSSSAACGAISNTVDGLDKTLRETAEIHSPSKLFAREAGHMMDGLIKGIEDKQGELKDCLASAVKSAFSTNDATSYGSSFGKSFAKAMVNAIKNTSFPTIKGTVNTSGGVASVSFQAYATGGFPSEGEMFIAREAGPEMVGSIGSRTAVANNDQIVDSVSQGVYRAVVQAMGQSGGNQVVEAKVNDKVLFEVVVNRNRQETMRTGYSPLLGGA